MIPLEVFIPSSLPKLYKNQVETEKCKPLSIFFILEVFLQIDKLFEPGNRHYPSKTAEQDPNLPTTSVAVPVAPPIQTEHEIHCPTVPHRRIPGPTARQRIEQTSTAIWHSVISPQTKYFIHMVSTHLLLSFLSIFRFLMPFSWFYLPLYLL